ncbi:hypothetical protein E5S69_13440 [Cupriavidus necator]|uniref:hypothetical protein n=1 Tax=Cupriavidus necator TaxID=106590 RepID=UPI00148F5EB0|nr:hypothetical protein [Cupriavidus necator]NOV24508.1 hypothetical protein [Cupriavidus necator]
MAIPLGIIAQRPSDLRKLILPGKARFLTTIPVRHADDIKLVVAAHPAALAAGCQAQAGDADFAPALASEKLYGRDGIDLTTETTVRAGCLPIEFGQLLSTPPH